MITSNFIAIYHIFLILVPIILGSAHIYFSNIIKLHEIVDAFLKYFLVIGIGLQGLPAGFVQIFKGEVTAKYNNWPFSPFIAELGFANLSYGILGIMCFWLSGPWWYATGIGYSVFLLGVTWVHITDIIRHKNFSLGNLGPTLWSNIAIPIITLTLLYMKFKLASGAVN